MDNSSLKLFPMNDLLVLIQNSSYNKFGVGKTKSTASAKGLFVLGRLTQGDNTGKAFI